MSLFNELKRRNVFRAGAAYLVSSWLIIQVTETIFPLFGLSDTPARIVVLVLAIGFIPAMVFAWVFEFTPEGLKKEGEVDHSGTAALDAGKKLDRTIMLVLVLALGFFAFDKFVLQPQRDAAESIKMQAEIELAREAGRSEALIESYGSKSIAVLPFIDMSPEGDQQYFADGVAEELLNMLSAFRELRVISRASSFSMRDQNLGAPELAEKLNVVYLLTGSVRKASDRVRISTQLIEASTDSQLWSETYERNVSDVFAVQDQIGAQVAGQLRINLLESRAHIATGSTRAYELYLRGRSLLSTRKGDDAHEARKLFEQAIQSDPEFVPAFTGMAIAMIFEDSVNYGETRIEAAANRALALDPDNSEAMTVLGRLTFDRGLFAEGRELFEKAIELSPSNALAWRWLGTSYSSSDAQRYYEYSQKALLLDPLDTSLLNHVAIAATRIGRYEEALALSRQLYEAGWADLAFEIADEVHRRNLDTSRQMQTIYRAYREDPDNPLAYKHVGLVLMNLGALDLAETWSLELKERGLFFYFHPLSSVYALAGDREKGMSVILDNDGQLKQEIMIGAQLLAWISLRIGRDYQGARALFEDGLTPPGGDGPVYDEENWEWFMRYAVTLRETGEPDRAMEIFTRILALIETRAATGMVSGDYQSLNYTLAQLYSETGQSQKAVTSLRSALNQNAITCMSCLKLEPHFDRLREQSAFLQVLQELESRFASQRALLEGKGLLLTPAQVMELKDFRFDPFTL